MLAFAVWVTVAVWPVGENIVGIEAPEDMVIVIIPDEGVGILERLVTNPDDDGLLGCAELC